MELLDLKMLYFLLRMEWQNQLGSAELCVYQVIQFYPPIVGHVTEIFTVLPSMQCNVEWLFSSLRIVKSDLRVSMEDLVKTILFLRANAGTTNSSQVPVGNEMLKSNCRVLLHQNIIAN